MKPIIFDQPIYEDQTFQRISVADKVLVDTTFINCTFDYCDFSQTQFNACEFEECRFISCNMSLFVPQFCLFKEIKFEGCKLQGVNWTVADWQKEGFLSNKRLYFSKCNLDQSIFLDVNMKKWTLRDCSIKEAEFEDAILEEADCRESDFLHSRFARTNLTRANFVGATHYNIDINVNVVTKAKFSLPAAVNLLKSLDIELVEP